MSGTNETVEDSETADVDAKPGKKKKFIIIAVVVLGLIIAATSYLFMNFDSLDSLISGEDALGELEEQIDGVLVEEELAPAPPPIFVKVGPITVNLVSDEIGQRLLYTSLMLKVDDVETEEIIKAHMPEVTSRLLLLLSSKTTTEMATVEGKTKLIEDVLRLFDQPLTRPQPTLGISAVLFSEFILQ